MKQYIIEDDLRQIYFVTLDIQEHGHGFITKRTDKKVISKIMISPAACDRLYNSLFNHKQYIIYGSNWITRFLIWCKIVKIRIEEQE